MDCSKCGGTSFGVVNTRVPKIDGEHSYNKALIAAADEAAAWYTRDYRARNRVCADCDQEEVTIELSLKDLNGMMEARFNEGISRGLRDSGGR